jgi:hypothetical protein
MQDQVVDYYTHLKKSKLAGSKKSLIEFIESPALLAKIQKYGTADILTSRQGIYTSKYCNCI